MSDLTEKLRGHRRHPDNPNGNVFHEAADRIEELEASQLAGNQARESHFINRIEELEAIIAADVDRVALGAQAMRITELEAENEEHMAAYRRVAAERDRLRAALQKIIDEDDSYEMTGTVIAEKALAVVEVDDD